MLLWQLQDLTTWRNLSARQKNGKALPAEMQTMVDALKQQSQQMKTTLAEEHVHAKTDVNAKFAAIGACETHRVTATDQIDTATTDAMYSLCNCRFKEAKRIADSEGCDDQLACFEHTKQMKQHELENFLQSRTNFFQSPTEECGDNSKWESASDASDALAWFSHYKADITRHEGTLQTLKSEFDVETLQLSNLENGEGPFEGKGCKTLREAKTAQTSECANLQIRATLNACHHYNTVKTHCDAYTECRDNTIRLWEETKTRETTDSQDRRNAWISADSILCYANAFTTDSNGALTIGDVTACQSISCDSECDQNTNLQAELSRQYEAAGQCVLPPEPCAATGWQPTCDVNSIEVWQPYTPAYKSGARTQQCGQAAMEIDLVLPQSNQCMSCQENNDWSNPSFVPFTPAPTQEKTCSTHSCPEGHTKINAVCPRAYCSNSACCSANVCTCSNGDEATAGTPSCHTNNAEVCAKCNDGYFLDGATKTCHACTPVENAASVTCATASNSRAVCPSGSHYRKDNSATGTSDECKSCTSCAATFPGSVEQSACSEFADAICECAQGFVGSQHGQSLQCTACTGKQYQDASGESTCLTCADGSDGRDPSGVGGNTWCENAVCQRPEKPATSVFADCPAEAAHNTQCTLGCAAGYFSMQPQPYTCLPDSGQTTASYQGGDIVCTPCPTVPGGACTQCDNQDTCNQVTCHDNAFDQNGQASDGCERGCPIVPGGTCTACSSPTTCTAVMCSDSPVYLDSDGVASNGCEVKAPCSQSAPTGKCDVDQVCKEGVCVGTAEICDGDDWNSASFARCDFWGDPHWTQAWAPTTRFDFMGNGVFDLAMSSDGSFKAQVFQCQVSDHVAVAIAVAAEFDGVVKVFLKDNSLTEAEEQMSTNKCSRVSVRSYDWGANRHYQNVMLRMPSGLTTPEGICGKVAPHELVPNNRLLFSTTEMAELCGICGNYRNPQGEHLPAQCSGTGVQEGNQPLVSDPPPLDDPCSICAQSAIAGQLDCAAATQACNAMNDEAGRKDCLIDYCSSATLESANEIIQNALEEQERVPGPQEDPQADGLQDRPPPTGATSLSADQTEMWETPYIAKLDDTHAVTCYWYWPNNVYYFACKVVTVEADGTLTVGEVRKFEVPTDLANRATYTSRAMVNIDSKNILACFGWLLSGETVEELRCFVITVSDSLDDFENKDSAYANGVSISQNSWMGGRHYSVEKISSSVFITCFPYGCVLLNRNGQHVTASPAVASPVRWKQPAIARMSSSSALVCATSSGSLTYCYPLSWSGTNAAPVLGTPGEFNAKGRTHTDLYKLQDDLAFLMECEGEGLNRKVRFYFVSQNGALQGDSIGTEVGCEEATMERLDDTKFLVSVSGWGTSNRQVHVLSIEVNADAKTVNTLNFFENLAPQAGNSYAFSALCGSSLVVAYRKSNKLRFLGLH